MFALSIVLLGSFVLGSIPTSLWMGRLTRGLDIRQHGSGNAGATNTFRILGWQCGVTVLVVDFMKGFTASFWLSRLAFQLGSGPISPPAWDVTAFVPIACGFFAVLGHAFSLLAQFKGGKGGATAAGMLYGIEPISISIAVVIFLVIMFSTRYVSLATILSVFAYPILQIFFKHVIGWDIDPSVIILSTCAAAFIIYKHKSNIERLLAGTENRVKSFRPSSGLANQDPDFGKAK